MTEGGVNGKTNEEEATNSNVVNLKNVQNSGKRRSAQNSRSGNDTTTNKKFNNFVNVDSNTQSIEQNQLNSIPTQAKSDANSNSLQTGNNATISNTQNVTMDENNNGSDLAILRQSGIAHPQQQVTLTCYIPPSKVGAVIGRGGRSILGIQREASRRSFNHPSPVRMSIVGTTPSSGNAPSEAEKDDENDNNQHQSAQVSASSSTSAPLPAPNSHQIQTDPYWTPVIIRGDPCGAFAAASLLLPLIDNEMDDVVLDIPIHRSRHSAIIGRRGNTIASLSADYNVRIMVPSGKEREFRSTTTTINTNVNTHVNAGVNGNTSPSDVVTSNALLNDGKEDQQCVEQQNSHIEPPEAAAVRRRRENPSNVQLEGSLKNVEMCLTKLLTVVAPNALNNLISSSTTAFQHSSTLDLKNDKTTNTQTTPTNDNNANTISHNTVSNTNKNHLVNNNFNNNTKRKNTEKVITAPPSSAHLLPSLTKLRQMGKKTGTTIRRKRINTAGLEMKEDSQVDADSTNNLLSAATLGTNSNSEKIEEAPTMQYETQFIISGRPESVDRCVELFESMFTSNNDTNVDPIPNEKKLEKRNSNNYRDEILRGVEKEDTPSAGASVAVQPSTTTNNHKYERSGRGGRGRGRGGGRGRGRGRGGGRSNTNATSHSHSGSATNANGNNGGTGNCISNTSNAFSN